VLPSHPFALAKPKHMLQSLPSHMVLGQAQKTWDHNIWQTAFLPQWVMLALSSLPA